MDDFARFDSQLERRFQGWLRVMGINPDEWFNGPQINTEDMNDLNGCPAGLEREKGMSLKELKWGGSPPST